MANIREGARRIRMLGKLIVVMAATASVLFWIVRIPFFVLPLPWVPLGAMVWAVGWILDGFAE